jgi:hypothetical protein
MKEIFVSEMKSMIRSAKSSEFARRLIGRAHWQTFPDDRSFDCQICATFPFLAMPFPFCRTKSLFHKPFGMNPSQPDASRGRGSGGGRNPQDVG